MPDTFRQSPRAALPPNLRVAIIHDWLVTLRGGERVLDALCELFPQAVVHTLVRLPGVATPRIEAMRHVTSFADRLPLAQKKHRWLLPLYPMAIESFDLSQFDLVLSSSHCVAKAALAGPGAVHVCYCHTPVRYAWDRTDDYVSGSSPLLKLARPALHVAAKLLRDFDVATLDRVDHFVANSHNTANKIKQFYHRDADVVPPPVEEQILRRLEKLVQEYDVVIIADYGHGLMTERAVKLVCERAKFLAVNAQTNAGNRGFNTISKYPRADYLCLDEAELRLAMGSRFGRVEDLVTGIAKKVKYKKAVITQGHRGSTAYGPEEGFSRAPVFSREIVDRMGAGDAFLSVTAPCAAAGVPAEVLGNPVGLIAEAGIKKHYGDNMSFAFQFFV